MPNRDDSAAFAADPGDDQQEEERRVSRRSVLRGAAGAGAAGLATAALSGVVAPARAVRAHHDGQADSAPQAGSSADEIVVHVRDARSGHIDVFRGTSQTSVRDPELAARLERASRA